MTKSDEIEIFREFPRPAVLPRPIGAIAAIARVIGPEAALVLAERRGGTSVYMPRPPVSESHELARLIGLEAAKILASSDIGTNGRNMLKVPLGRDFRIIVYRQAGWSYSQIALALCIDENTVHQSLQGRGVTGRKVAKTGELNGMDQVAKFGDLKTPPDQVAKFGREPAAAAEGSDHD